MLGLHQTLRSLHRLWGPWSEPCHALPTSSSADLLPREKVQASGILLSMECS